MVAAAAAVEVAVALAAAQTLSPEAMKAGSNCILPRFFLPGPPAAMCHPLWGYAFLSQLILFGKSPRANSYRSFRSTFNIPRPGFSEATAGDPGVCVSNSSTVDVRQLQEQPSKPHSYHELYIHSISFMYLPNSPTKSWASWRWSYFSQFQFSGPHTMAFQ